MTGVMSETSVSLSMLNWGLRGRVKWLITTWRGWSDLWSGSQPSSSSAAALAAAEDEVVSEVEEVEEEDEARQALFCGLNIVVLKG